jgi:hypothetical protein
MKREIVPLLLALSAICCLSARSRAAEAENPIRANAPEAAADDDSESGLAAAHVEHAADEDRFEDYEIRAYVVADILTPTPSYPSRGGLPTVASQRSTGLLGNGIGGAGYQEGSFDSGGGFGGAGMGGMGGGGMGMFSVPTQPDQTHPEMGTGARGPARAAGPSRKRQPASRDLDDLIKVIKTLAVPDRWADVGGYGEIAHFGGTLLVLQTPEGHEQVEHILEAIRAEGVAAQTMIVDAHWLILDSGQLATLLGPDLVEDERPLKITVGRTALSKLAREAPGYRGRITCFSGQTVHLASGSRRTVVTGAIPVVGSGAAYQPIMANPNVGVVLEVTPSMLPGSDEAVVDLHSTVTEWSEPDPPVRIGTTAATSHAAAGLLGETVEDVESTAAIEVDRPNIPTQQLSTTLRMPLNKPVLVGGLTLQPTQPASDDDPDGSQTQLVLIVRVGASDG